MTSLPRRVSEDERRLVSLLLGFAADEVEEWAYTSQNSGLIRCRHCDALVTFDDDGEPQCNHSDACGLPRLREAVEKAEALWADILRKENEDEDTEV